METLLKVDLSTIKEQTGGVLELTEKLHLPSQGGVDFPEPVTVNVQVNRTNQGYYVSGKIQGRYKVPCDRCLETIWEPLTAEFAENFYDRRGREREETDKIAGPEGLDLTPTLLEAITFGLPMKHLCRADCRGLCSVCGKNLNLSSCSCSEQEIDPRLAVLAKWKK
ncbi:MAG: DUF177 domain-containing protein [Firmicutes bacterium]|nr:DUF177 domain-containing protein [Bacillota bacterium]